MIGSSPGVPATTEPRLTVRDAIKVVAQEIAARAVREWPEWADFPEIAEGDWDAVLSEMDSVNEPVESDLYLRAYALLAGRAEDHE